jgi:ABC-type nitrate/sulfonate/bicarbonate transport system substrate-binding protein
MIPTAKRLVLALALGATLATPASAQQNAPLTKVRMAYDGFSMTSAPLNYAVQQGIFKRFGLDITPTFIEGGSMLTQAIVGGSLDIAQNGYTPAAAAAVQGADIVFIGGIANTLPYQLLVKTSVTSAQQLKGKSIGISRYGSSTDAAADFALKHLGLTRADVSILQLGGAATRMAAAISGRVDGTFEQYPDTAELTRHGFHVLVDLTNIVTDYPNTSFVTTRAFLKKHPEIVKKFLMAMATAVDEFKKNPELAIRLTQKFLDVKDEGNMRSAYAGYLNAYPPKLTISLKGIEGVLRELSRKEPKASAFKAEQLVDTTTLDQLERDGFFAKLADSRS